MVKLPRTKIFIYENKNENQNSLVLTALVKGFLAKTSTVAKNVFSYFILIIYIIAPSIV